MDHSFFFVKKPPTYIKNSAIQSVDFDRVSTSSAANKTIDMRFVVNEAGKPVEYSFTSINRDEFENLKDWMQSRNIPYTVTQADSGMNLARAGYDDEMGGDVAYRAMLEDAAEGDSDEDDSDFGSEQDSSDAESDEESGGSDEDMAEEVRRHYYEFFASFSFEWPSSLLTE
jgi:structure-specific recognition protein 1